MNKYLHITDGQNTFMDIYGAALPVNGATKAMNHLATHIMEKPASVYGLSASFDRHQHFDVSFATMFVDKNGNNPENFAVIVADDLASGVWHTAISDDFEPVLAYIRAVEADGRTHMVFNPHAQEGTWQYAMYQPLESAVGYWVKENRKRPYMFDKGEYVYREQFGGYVADLPDQNVPSTMLNMEPIELHRRADVIGHAGIALDFCVRATLDQEIKYIGKENVNKLYLLLDATSAVLPAPKGSEYTVEIEEWLHDIQGRGVNLVTTEQFFKL